MSESFDERRDLSLSELFSVGPGRSGRLWPRIILIFSQWYAFLLLGRDMGPSLGAVTTDLTDQNLRYSIPDDDPPGEMLAAARNTVFDSSPSDILGRANRWSAALQSRVRAGELRVPARTVLTTYGLVSFRTGIRLSVIHYLEPAAIFGLIRRPPPARIDDSEFPVVIRPAEFVPMSTRTKLQDSSSLRGNIWLKLQHKAVAKLGYLTAHHAVRGTRIGATITPPTYRFPPPGVLTHRSEVMDCAVVRTDFDHGFDFRPVHLSTVIGYKPVRLITGNGDIDAQVVEHDGHIQGVIPRSEGRKEPPGRATVILNKKLTKGHSGCLVVDCEFEQIDMPAVPYAMYIGAWSGATRGLGVCQLLEQARRHWNLEFCEPWEGKDERRPRIG